jgi:cytochrome c oxidase subunit 2
MMHMDRYERGWIRLSIVLLAVFTIAIALSGFAFGIQVPVPEQRVDPRIVTTPGVSQFAEPGLRELAPNRYELYMYAQMWNFCLEAGCPAVSGTAPELRIPQGATVTFYLTSKDIQHGFKLTDTNINMMVLPGQVSKLTATFDEAGEHLFICHEYCGGNHHRMYGKLIVEG